jgi:hypothetical protein
MNVVAPEIGLIQPALDGIAKQSFSVRIDESELEGLRVAAPNYRLYIVE